MKISGAYHIQVQYENIPIPQSPLTVIAQRGFDAGHCRASGGGLERGLVGVPCQFLVETKVNK